MAFCSACGKELENGAAFCSGCGAPVGNSVAPKKEETESVVLEAKGSLLGGGMGRIVLTNQRIMWTKSKVANFMAGGVLSLLTKGDTAVDLHDISTVDTWMFLGGGGLAVHTRIGKTYKFGFQSKKDRDTAMAYIQENHQ